MARIEESKVIQGVYTVLLVPHQDERGCFVETFRKEWFPERTWEAVQGNVSYSKAGVLRGLHYHHRQIDYWCVPSGRMRVGLCDLRASSSTYRAVQTFEIDDTNFIGVYIPTGVAHGFLALTEVILTYLVDNYYDASDEYGVAWNDPEIGLDWETTTPKLSPRDAANPLLRDIPADDWPK